MGMLVLSGYPEEEFVIGDEVRIKILGVSGERVSIGFDAPNDIPIDRAKIRSDKKAHGTHKPSRPLKRPEN